MSLRALNKITWSSLGVTSSGSVDFKGNFFLVLAMIFTRGHRRFDWLTEVINHMPAVSASDFDSVVFGELHWGV